VNLSSLSASSFLLEIVKVVKAFSCSLGIWKVC
jgi:hypothetical protein